jgi:hypothetical protein
MILFKAIGGRRRITAIREPAKAGLGTICCNNPGFAGFARCILGFMLPPASKAY